MSGTPNFPLVSHDHVIKLIQPDDYGKAQKQPFVLNISPPLNSYKIMSAPRSTSNPFIEYFLHSDSSKIIR